MSEEELKKTINIVAGIEVHSEAEAIAKEELISYVEQLQQENHILKQAVDNTYETSQDTMYEMQQKNKELKEQNKSLKKYYEFDNKSWRDLAIKQTREIEIKDNILTEFEKWLEEKLKEKTYNTFPTFDLEKHDFVNNKMYFSRVDKIYKEVLDKLQELKEGKK